MYVYPFSSSAYGYGLIKSINIDFRSARVCATPHDQPVMFMFDDYCADILPTITDQVPR